MTGGQMYPWIEYTWNPLAGACLHDCEYCYVKALAKRFKTIANKYTGEIRIDEKALNTKPPRNRTIFICSMNDLFASGVPKEYILRILGKTKEWDDGSRIFLFQSKNPIRMVDFANYYPKNAIFGTTIESNFDLVKTNAPSVTVRAEHMTAVSGMVSHYRRKGYNWKVMVSIEPILRFEPDDLADMIRKIGPDFVSIGADSKKNNLDEPDGWSIAMLVRELRKFTEVYLKKNLSRLVALGDIERR